MKESNPRTIGLAIFYHRLFRDVFVRLDDVFETNFSITR